MLDGSAQATLVQLVLWDSAGAYEYNRLEPLKYPKANIILIGFSVDSPDSLESVEDKVVSRPSPFYCHEYRKLTLSCSGYKKSFTSAPTFQLSWSA